jgi:hypothetical protein
MEEASQAWGEAIMPETRTPAVQFDYRCDECGRPLRYTGRSIMVAPPGFIHACDGCRREYTLGRVYPVIEPKKA